MVRKILIPPLHPKQQIIYDSDARFKVIAAGRRFGKTRLALSVALEYAVNQGKKVWWVAPASSVSQKHWDLVKTLLAGNWSSKSEIYHELQFHYTNEAGIKQYGSLTFRSGDRPDNLRGDGLELVVFDEAAYIHPYVWTVLRPSLNDKKGDAIFISTPNGLNWFYTLYNRGISDIQTWREWQSWQHTSYDNPFLDPAEIDADKNEMTEDEFAQEHLAQFNELEGRVFRNVNAVAVLDQQTTRQRDHVYTFGIDWARKHDATVISIMDATDSKQADIVRLTSMDFTTQRAIITGLISKWKPLRVLVEENAAGMPIIDEFRSEGVNVEPFYTSHTSKPPLIQSLALAIEKQSIEILSDDSAVGKIQYNELKAYEMKLSRSGSNWSYSAPRGMLDDTVIALALSWKAAQEVKPTPIIIGHNPFYGTSSKTVSPPTRMSAAKQKARERIMELLGEK